MQRGKMICSNLPFMNEQMPWGYNREKGIQDKEHFKSYGHTLVVTVTHTQRASRDDVYGMEREHSHFSAEEK